MRPRAPLRRVNEQFSGKPFVHDSRTDNRYSRRRALSIAAGRSRTAALRDAARHRNRAGGDKRARIPGLLDFCKSARICSDDHHAHGIRHRVRLWRIAGRFLEWPNDRETPVPFPFDCQSGLPLRIEQAWVRNLMRTVDALPLAYLVGGSSALSSPIMQRFGDRVAGTLGVRETA